MSEPVAKAILLCNYALQDRANRWTLAAIFEYVQAKSMPANIAPFYIYVRLLDCPRQGRYTFLVEDPDGIVIWTSGSQVLSIPESSESLNWNLVWSTPSIGVSRFGKYRVAVYVNADRIADTDLGVIETPAAVPEKE